MTAPAGGAAAICHAHQACQRIRECKPKADWSWESDNPGVVDYWRLYALDPVYEELLTLPSIYNICQRAIIEGRGGPGVQPHPAGPILVHEMGQHAPAHTPGGQAWHQHGGPTDGLQFGEGHRTGPTDDQVRPQQRRGHVVDVGGDPHRGTGRRVRDVLPVLLARLHHQ